MTFEALGIDARLIQATNELGYVNPTAIQEQAIPVLLSGTTDFIGLAQTGTGKTAAFGLPLLLIRGNRRFWFVVGLGRSSGECDAKFARHRSTQTARRTNYWCGPSFGAKPRYIALGHHDYRGASKRLFARRSRQTFFFDERADNRRRCHLQVESTR